jgi:hypothetical protein
MLERSYELEGSFRLTGRVAYPVSKINCTSFFKFVNRYGIDGYFRECESVASGSKRRRSLRVKDFMPAEVNGGEKIQYALQGIGVPPVPQTFLSADPVLLVNAAFCCLAELASPLYRMRKLAGAVGIERTST